METGNGILWSFFHVCVSSCEFNFVFSYKISPLTLCSVFVFICMSISPFFFLFTHSNFGSGVRNFPQTKRVYYSISIQFGTVRSQHGSRTVLSSAGQLLAHSRCRLERWQFRTRKGTVHARIIHKYISMPDQLLYYLLLSQLQCGITGMDRKLLMCSNYQLYT
jgi:hypothetical protein